MYAASVSAAEVLATTQADLPDMALLHCTVNPAPIQRPHPRVADAGKVTRAAHGLKDAGHTRAEVAQMLGLSEPTVRRH